MRYRDPDRMGSSVADLLLPCLFEELATRENVGNGARAQCITTGPTQERSHMSTHTIARGVKTKTLMVALDALTRDSNLQPRVQMSDVKPREYAEAMQRGDTFPPIRVIANADHQWLVDGWHRDQAARLLNRKELLAEISSGTYEDAEDYVLASEANRSHGLPRTHADVQNAICRALLMKRWQERSDNWIAKHIGCSDKTVTVHREQLESTSEIPTLRKLVGEDGKARTRTIPKRVVAPEPAKTGAEEHLDDDDDV